jgi:hypothetical protein
MQFWKLRDTLKLETFRYFRTVPGEPHLSPLQIRLQVKVRIVDVAEEIGV